MKYPKVYIIILNWNGLKDTLECLESVFKLDYPYFGVIVVDNGSADDSIKVIRDAYPQVILIENKENLGYTGGNNVGMHYAVNSGSDYIWLLNNDTVVEPDTLSRLLSVAKDSPDIGLISPAIYDYVNPDKVQFCGGYIDWKTKVLSYTRSPEEYLLWKEQNSFQICLWGAALIINTMLIKHIGYLDDRFFAYWEDADFSVRSSRSGFRNLVVLSARVRHKTVPRSSRSAHYFYYMARNKYYFWRKHLTGFERIFYVYNYLASTVMDFAFSRECGAINGCEASLDGAWAALVGVSGAWNHNLKMPRIFKKILSWHPYLWGDLLGGNFFNIASGTVKRFREKIAGLYR